MEVAKTKPTFRHADVQTKLEKLVTRQYLSTILGEMVKEGVLIREKAGRNTEYALPKNLNRLSGKVAVSLKNQNLEEHIVWDALKERSPLLKTLKENVFSVLDFAFQEMMNNAIEHSQSAQIKADIYKKEGDVFFDVSDTGIGVFRNIKTRFKLNSEIEAIQELLKGKTTTKPAGHTGQGIFFTSKVADLFILDSFDYRLRVDNQIDDLFIEKLEKPVKGTKVIFKIATNSKRHAGTVFKKYETDPEDTAAFDKTEVPIKLYTMSTIYISRSQARRVLMGLQKFKSVVFDFEGVPTIGQAFADEVFRVWRRRYPNTQIRPINMNEAVKFMVDRVEI
jgi:anti-sigma regulatory factor (Ser/Thr protein kinase)